MTKRSLQASTEGIKKAKQAFKRKSWTQEYLASQVGLETRQPIWKFFAGKPVDRHVFTDICFTLGLDPDEIAQKPEETNQELPLQQTPEDKVINIDGLTQKVRASHYEKIKHQCGTLRLLDIARPVGLDDLYVDVNILEEITSKRWLEISDLQSFDPNEFDRFGLGKVRQERVAGLAAVEKYSKLMVIGKPGSGKTTFLQSIAIRCNQGEFQRERLPIFISLKNFAEDTRGSSNIGLLKYINQGFSSCDILEPEIVTLLDNGRAIILLDGLDEVPEEDSNEIIKQIRQFNDKYYKNQIIITCRIAAQQYKFKGFTEVEIADFTKPQIASFAKKWFLVVGKNTPRQGKALASQFIEMLELPENRQMRELATTPILLNLTCLVFQFIGDFPTKRSELYRQGLELLLVRWDEARGIKRDEVYRNLSLLHKIKLLSQVAAITFEQGNYFFEESKLQQLITDYLRHLPYVANEPEVLELDSKAVIKSIESQHGLLVERARGIYSFSHLTFQEYFTARELVVSGNPENLQQLVPHLTEKRWREVFLLTAGMMQPADNLLQLMKQQVDYLAKGEKLQHFLSWLQQKSSTVAASYHQAAVRAFYFTLALPPDHALARNESLALALDRDLAGKLTDDLALDLALAHALAVTLAITGDLFSNRYSAIKLALDLDHLPDNPSLRQALQHLKNQLPSPNQGREALKAWWQANRQDWTGQLRNVMISHRQIGHEWEFSQEEWQLLQQYWDANQLLLDCLNSAGDLTPNLRQSIEKSLLLP